MMIRGSQIAAIAALTTASLLSGVWINRAIAQVGSNQPVRNPGISGISSPASSVNGGATRNPGISGISSPASSGNSGSGMDQPVTNPGVSGGNNPTPGLSQPNPSVDGSQPITNPGVSGIDTPSLTQPNQPTANPDTIRTIVLPSDVPRVIVQPRTNPAPASRTPQVTQPTTPQTPTQTDSGRETTGFVRTAIANQVANNPNTQRLDAQLLQATCSQNWQGAIAIVDRALESAPTNQVYRSQLRTYRSRLETLSTAKTVIPNWSQKCAGG